MTIRKMQPGDGPALTQLIARYRQEQGKEFGPAARAGAARAFAALAAEKPDAVMLWVAVDENRVPRGYLNAHIGWFPLLGGEELYVSDLLVDEQLRGQRIGSTLLRAAEDWAVARGCVRIMLNNLKSDHSYDRGFYVSQGFEEREHVANMVKKLPASG
ncbi:GNAT family N-acetyltransferase [Spirochaeta africana]|uniref:Putative acetyltransferase n=1 Tax=Spirochaeta africana (strain ATCC 700263 / DSM 8902 / Z-7692) TaxID=889378 RepID=H9UHX6_SPIAZ|nr:GNAT family N-acetyltransferase [Spirochaeta africana]AFG37119.1 putative acetyltransferase [Spirochaeta africana DSM 8902]